MFRQKLYAIINNGGIKCYSRTMFRQKLYAIINNDGIKCYLDAIVENILLFIHERIAFVHGVHKD